MSRRFNTAGPCRPGVHYMISPLRRLPRALDLVEMEEYFVVHAPRQTGKTTILRALAEELTAKGTHAALHFSCEVGESAGDDYGQAQRSLLNEVRSAAARTLPPDLHPPSWPDAPEGNLLKEALAAWAQACPRPLVLLFDEIDSLRGRTLISVLRQLRAGFVDRPDWFPSSVVLCGLRDVREYKTAAGSPNADRLGTASPFNIKVDSLRINNFTPDEVAELYGQHTTDTGQPFTDDAVQRAYDYTSGQPWLVNALAREIILQMSVQPPVPITADHIDQAKERLIQARATHLDSLAHRLTEPRVRRVIEPLITGEPQAPDQPTEIDTYDDDVRYLIDLGLIAPTGTTAIANPIYREVIIRVLGAGIERDVPADPRRFIRPDGRLDLPLLLQEFADFWRANAETMPQRTSYREAATQLVFMAYLHKVVNGGGYIDREYGLGRKRTDILIRWPYLDPNGKRHWQHEALELKVWRPKQADPTPDGLRQLDGYLTRLNLDHGTLIVFDQRPNATPLPDRISFTQDHTPTGRTITLLHA